MLPSFMLSCGALNSRLRPQTHGGPILWPSRLDCCVIAVEPPVLLFDLPDGPVDARKPHDHVVAQSIERVVRPLEVD
jgi:hypothetical protein